MPNIGPMELAVVLVIALVVLGPKRLPDVGRSLGRGMREFKRSITGEEPRPATVLDGEGSEEQVPVAHDERRPSAV